uniref:Uncharacterized protein n=1 Tax=Tanacetum cinerariifolium TaxID=118510 RepID=A0A699KVE1_TANCI|nr:hypothetical protein [Tanacetum cinerariifolium]
MKVALEPSLGKEVAAMGPRVEKRRRKKGNDKAKANASPKDAPTAVKSVSNPDPLSYVKPQPHLELDIAQKTAIEIPTENVATKRYNARSSRRVWSQGYQPPSPPWTVLQESSGDFSKAGGVPEDPNAMFVSFISITRLAVAVSSGTS